MPREGDILEAIDKLSTSSRRARPYIAIGLLAIFAGFIFFSIYSNSLRVKAEQLAESRTREAESWRRQAESWRRRTVAVEALLERARGAASAGNRQRTNELLREASEQTQSLSTETAAAAAPPLFPDSAWSSVATDPSGNVYAIHGDGVGNSTSPRRSIWVRGDHQADQTIMHRYSMTLWAVNCADQSFALTSRTNYHADGSVDRRPLPNPRVSPPVIAALGARACR